MTAHSSFITGFLEVRLPEMLGSIEARLFEAKDKRTDPMKGQLLIQQIAEDLAYLKTQANISARMHAALLLAAMHQLEPINTTLGAQNLGA